MKSKRESKDKKVVIFIKASNDSPEITYNIKKNILEIRGISIVKNPKKFYNPLIDWLGENWYKFKNKFTLVLAFNFFNAPSAKMILEIFKQLVDLKYSERNKKIIIVNWVYSKGDLDLREAGEIYADMFPDLHFKFVEESEEDIK